PMMCQRIEREKLHFLVIRRERRYTIDRVDLICLGSSRVRNDPVFALGMRQPNRLRTLRKEIDGRSTPQLKGFGGDEPLQLVDVAVQPDIHRDGLLTLKLS